MGTRKLSWPVDEVIATHLSERVIAAQLAVRAARWQGLCMPFVAGFAHPSAHAAEKCGAEVGDWTVVHKDGFVEDRAELFEDRYLLGENLLLD